MARKTGDRLAKSKKNESHPHITRFPGYKGGRSSLSEPKDAQIGEKNTRLITNFHFFCFYGGTFISAHQKQAPERKIIMKEMTESLIRAILSGDNTVTEDQAEKVLRFCKKPQDHRSLIGPKEAMAILGVSRPTLRAYVKRGLVDQIAFSSRKLRFDAETIHRLADKGVTTYPRPNASIPLYNM